MMAAENWGRAQLLRGTLRAYDAETHVADVEPAGASTALLEGLAVLGCVAPSELSPGRMVSLLLWPDVGGVVLGPAVAPYASMRLWDAGCVATESAASLSISYADLVTVERTLPVAGVLYAQGAVTVQVDDFAWANLSKAQMAVEGVGQHEVATRALQGNSCQTLATGAVATLEAGERSWSLQAKKNGDVNAHTALAGAHLAWMVFL